jgi:hypothetical protein
VLNTLFTFLVPGACYLFGEAIANALWGETFSCNAGAVEMEAVRKIKNNLNETPRG